MLSDYNKTLFILYFVSYSCSAVSLVGMIDIYAL